MQACCERRELSKSYRESPIWSTDLACHMVQREQHSEAHLLRSKKSIFIDRQTDCRQTLGSKKSKTFADDGQTDTAGSWMGSESSKLLENHACHQKRTLRVVLSTAWNQIILTANDYSTCTVMLLGDFGSNGWKFIAKVLISCNRCERRSCSRIIPRAIRI